MSRDGAHPGLSPLEIAIGLAILAIALAGLFGLMIQSIRPFRVDDGLLKGHQSVQLTLDTLLRDA